MAVMTGTNGRDFLRGTSNSDDITGRWGGDWLYGGRGYDKFIYTSIYDSPAFGPKDRLSWWSSSCDIIIDFHQGFDKIDLTAILGDQNLLWGNTSPIAQGVWYAKIGGNTHIFVDTLDSKILQEITAVSLTRKCCDPIHA